MATNTLVLIIVAAVAALVLAGMLAVVVSKTRTRARDGRGATMTEELAKQRRRRGTRADESAARARGAMVEIENSLQHQATSYRSEAVTTRDQLNEQRVHRLAG
jgi:hypothetical protein